MRFPALMCLVLAALTIAGPASATGGTLTAWGANDWGELNVPAASDITQISVGLTHGMGLRADGSVIAWGTGHLRTEDLATGTPSAATVPSGLGEIVQVSSGDGHLVALRSDGTVIAWGRADLGQTPAPPGLSDVVQIAAGSHHTLALHADGTLTAWGWNDWGQLDIPAGLADIVHIAAGTHHNLALHSDGRITTWGGVEGGPQDHGQARVPASIGEAVLVAASNWNSMALLADGSVAVWGANDSAQTSVTPGIPPAIGIASGLHNAAAVHADGSVSIWGGNQSGQLDAPAGLTGITHVALGRYHSLALAAADAATLTVAGTVAPGSEVTAQLTDWPGSTGEVRYQWYVDGRAVAAATGESYTIADHDAGKAILVRAISTTRGTAPIVSSALDIAPRDVSTTAPGAADQDGGFPWPIIGGLVALVVAGGAIAFIVLRHRRKREA